MMYARETLALHSACPDLIPQDAPATAWNNVQNVFFRNGETLRAFGDVPTLPTSREPRTCIFMRTPANAAYWVYATSTGIYAHDGTTEFDITPASGWAGAGVGTVYTSCVLGGIVYLNASDRDPVYWPGSPASPCVVLPDWPTNGRCLALRAHKNFLFAIGMLSEGGSRVRWSDAAEAGTVPQHWTPAADNLAGFVDLTPLSSPCREGHTMRDDFLVYKEESIWAFTFVGGNDIFATRKLFAEHGIAATNALCAGPNDEHLFIGDDGDCYATDAVRVASVLDGKAQRTFYADFTSEPDPIFSAFALSREKLGFLIYPSSSNTTGNLALIYDFSSGDIGFRDMPDVLCAAEGQALIDVGNSNEWDGDPNSWDSDRTRWNQVASASSVDDVIIGGDFGFRIVSDPSAVDFADGPVQAVVEKSGLAFGNPQRRKMVNRVWPKITGDDGDIVQVRLGGQDIANGPVSLGAPVNFVIGSDMPIDTFVQGRFLSIEILTEGIAPWRMGSIDVEYREVGKW